MISSNFDHFSPRRIFSLDHPSPNAMGITRSRLGLGSVDVHVLNDPPGDTVVLISSTESLLLLEHLEITMRRIQGEFISEDGLSVDYAGIRNSVAFVEYLVLVRNLSSANLDSLLVYDAEAMKKAFFINVYNLLTVHALVEVNVEGDTKSPAKIPNFWRKYAYRIGGLVFSLDDIEHGVLRGNKPHPFKARISRSHFVSDDPRTRFALSTCDPRIHFCLNCGARSCPRISVFTAKKGSSALDAALDSAAAAFCQDNVQLDQEKNVILLSKIFDWYGGDFGNGHGETVQKIMSWLDSERQAVLTDLIGRNAQVKFVSYDWSLNSK